MDNGVRSSDCANNRNETPRISQQDLQRHLAIVRNINAQYRNLLSDLNDHYEFLKSVQKCKNCNYTPRMDKVNHMQEQLIRVHSLNNEKVKMIKQLRELIENKINQLDAQNNNNNNNNNVKIKEVKDVALQTDLWTCSCDIMKKNNSNKKNDNDDTNNDINDNKFNKNNDDNYDDSGPCCSRDIVNQIKVKPCASTNFTTNDSKVNAVKGDKNKSVATAKKFCSKTDTTTIDNNSKEYKNSYEYFKILPPNKRAKWYTEMYMKTELEAIKAKTTNEVGNDNVVKLKNINKKNNNKNSNAQKSANNANSSKIIENSNRATKTWATSKNTNNTNTSGNKAGTTKKATKTLYNKGGTSKKALTTLDCQPSTSKKTTGYRTNYGNGPSTSTGIRNWTDRGIENEATTNTSTGTGTGTGTRTGKNNNGRKRTNTDRGGGKRKKRKGRAAGRPPKKVAPIVPAVPITPIVSLLEPIDPYEPTYCVCNQISFGEMILCDNDLCPIEWFHFPCVSLITKPRGKWYCPICRGARSNIMRPKAEFIKELIRYNKEKEDAAQD